VALGLHNLQTSIDSNMVVKFFKQETGGKLDIYGLKIFKFGRRGKMIEF